MTPIHIVYVLGYLKLGGTETQLLELLARINRTQFTPIIYAFGRDGHLRSEFETLGIPVVFRPYSITKNVSQSAWLRGIAALMRDMTRFFRQQRPTIAQSFLPTANLFTAICAKFAGVPVIITGRRATMNAHASDFPAFPHQWLLHLSNLWVSAVLANSSRLKEACLAQERWLSPQNIYVIHNGVNTERFRPMRLSLSLKHAFGIPAPAPVVGVIANLAARKGHRDILNAAEAILRQIPETCFAFIGRDEGMQRELERMAKSAGIRDSIIFAGQQSNIPEWLSIIDIVVSASLEEGMSNALLEGMAAGKPLVATRIAGTPEIVIDGITGLLIPPGEPDALAEAILQMLRNRNLREKMGSAGHQRARELFQIERFVTNTEAFYRALIPQKSL